MKFVALIFIIIFSACTTVTPLTGPSGRPAYSINCRRSIDMCYAEASSRCPSGYQIINASQKVRGHTIVGGSIHTISDDNIFVECSKHEYPEEKPSEESRDNNKSQLNSIF